jgi:hypothetical protein
MKIFMLMLDEFSIESLLLWIFIVFIAIGMTFLKLSDEFIFLVIVVMRLEFIKNVLVLLTWMIVSLISKSKRNSC